MSIMRRQIGRFALAVLTIAASLVLFRSTVGADRDVGQHVAEQLSCPTCAGQSVAQSDSPVAAAMRKTITDQLATGRSPGEIRAWFVDRYGPEVLRSTGGPALLLAAVLLTVAGGTAVSVLVRRRRPHLAKAVGPAPLHRHRRLVFNGVSILVVTVVAGVAAGSWWMARRSDAAANPTSSDDPLTRDLAAVADPSTQLRQAFAQLRAGYPDMAAALASSALRAIPENADAVLILGLAQRAQAAPEADRTLGQFLAMAPEHPAAAEVRRLIGHPTAPSTQRNTPDGP